MSLCTFSLLNDATILLLAVSTHTQESLVYTISGNPLTRSVTRHLFSIQLATLTTLHELFPLLMPLTHTGIEYCSHVTTLLICCSEFALKMAPEHSNLHRRLSQPVAGACLAPLSGGRVACFLLTTLGDLFYQCWRYTTSSFPQPTIPTQYQLWAQQAIEQETVSDHHYYQQPIQHVSITLVTQNTV